MTSLVITYMDFLKKEYFMKQKRFMIIENVIQELIM